jgi:hypothetical protein
MRTFTAAILLEAMVIVAPAVAEAVTAKPAA